MANLPLAFGELLVAAILIDSAIKGDSIANVVRGVATQQPLSLGGSAAAASSGGAAAPAVNTNGYVNPLPQVSNWERTDQGVDASLPVGAPILAAGNGKVLGILQNWFKGQPLLYYQLSDGPDAGKVIYVAEQIIPTVKPGDTLTPGQVIATYAPTGTALETGWATDTGETLARSTTGYTEGEVTPAGRSFRDFLNSLGAKAGNS